MPDTLTTTDVVADSLSTTDVAPETGVSTICSELLPCSEALPCGENGLGTLFTSVDVLTTVAA